MKKTGKKMTKKATAKKPTKSTRKAKASKKTASKKTASKKTASKKTASKKTASKKRTPEVLVTREMAKAMAKEMAKAKKTDPRRAIHAALGVQPAMEFVYAMRDLAFSANPWLELGDCPPAVATVRGLCLFDLAASNGGLRQFIDQSEGAFFHEIESYCRTIGALRTLKYLQEAAKLFPKGRVPRDDDKRADVTEAYEQTSPLDPPNPFIILDEKYGQEVAEEVPAKLRVWVSANADELAGELAAL